VLIRASERWRTIWWELWSV